MQFTTSKIRIGLHNKGAGSLYDTAGLVEEYDEANSSWANYPLDSNTSYLLYCY